MTSYLRKNIAMGNYSLLNQSQNFVNVASDFVNSDFSPNTPWVRMWVDWFQLAPYAANNPANDTTTVIPPGRNDPPTSNNGSPAFYVYALDTQIRYARALGLKVILTFFNTPGWASLVPDGTPNGKLYPPVDLSFNGWWSAYFGWALLRWNPYNPSANGAWCDVLEIGNEPNLAIVPNNASVEVTAQKMLVAYQWQIALASAYPGYVTTPVPLLGAPALDDNTSSDGSNCETFTENLLNRLVQIGFPIDGNPYWIWTHHNYRDMASGSVPANQTQTRAHRVRLKLQGRWGGWPYQDKSNPYMFLTEGGVQLKNGMTLSEQSDRVAKAHDALHDDSFTTSSGSYYGGKGLAMLSQYLDITDPGFDTGLRDPTKPYVARPVYSRWRGLSPT